MATRISTEQRNAIEHSAGKPVTVEDEQNHIQYVLVRLDTFERMKKLLDDGTDIDVRDTYPALDAMTTAAGWNDPSMDCYDEDKPLDTTS